MPKIKHAIAWRSGRIRVVAKIPLGACHITSGPEHQLRRLMQATARHGYQRGILLVPGVPEADTDHAAAAAMIRWRDWVTKRQPESAIRNPRRP